MLTKRSVVAVFDATGGNRFEKIYGQYARGPAYVKVFTESILKVFGEEFGAVPLKKNKKGELVDLKAGDIFNLEHGNERGIVESLIRDAVDNAVLESNVHTKADVNRFFKENDVELSLIRDTKTDTMEVFLGSKVINAAEGIKSKKAKANLGKALVQAIQKLESSGNKLSYMKATRVCKALPTASNTIMKFESGSWSRSELIASDSSAGLPSKPEVCKV